MDPIYAEFLSERRAFLARAAGLLLPLGTCAVLAGLGDPVTQATAALILVLWVVACAASGDRVAGLLAALSGGLWFDFFLTAPYHQLAISDSDDLEVTILLVVIGGVVTEIALWGRRQQARAARRTGYIDGVLSTASAVAEGDTPTPVVLDLVSQQISDVLDVDGCRFVPGPVDDPRLARLDQGGVVTRDGHQVDVVRRGLPFDEETAIPVRRGATVLGYFVITSATRIVRPSQQQLRVAVLLADQVAPALTAH